MSLKMDGGRPEDRVVELYPATHPRLDHGYAVTSHSSQGQIAGRVLIHIDRYRAGGPKTCSTTASLTLPVRAGPTMCNCSLTAESSSARRSGMMFRTRAPVSPTGSRVNVR
jgi:hypothetical protein